MARLVRTCHTNQPYIQFAVYEVDGEEVIVRLGGMRQSWDCQPFRAGARLNNRAQDTPYIRAALAAAGVALEE